MRDLGTLATKILDPKDPNVGIFSDFYAKDNTTTEFDSDESVLSL